MAKTQEEQDKRRQRLSAKRIQGFLYDFSRESQAVRDGIVKDLPAYNMLLSTQAETFEEIALRMLSEERKVPYIKDSPPMPVCPHCKQYVRVGRKGKGSYYCNACEHKFTATHNSIVSGTKCDALTWMKVLLCLMNFSGMSKTCEYADISPETYYQIRTRLFYGMQLMMDEVKLYGLIEADNTFVRANYKGMDLKESEFEEDSIFFDDSYKPRAARKRGEANSMQERNANSICVFTAISDRGRVLARFAGIGAASYSTLRANIPADKFLLSVPEADSFDCLARKQKQEPQTAPGDQTIMVMDKERAIKKLAGFLGLQCETHVFRDNGTQRRLGADAHHIQHINACHKRLKDFLRSCKGISSKYLPGYLTFFEWLENTGGSQEAINQLFRILSTPGLGKPPKFFKNLYTVPNYLTEWFSGDHPLRKLPDRKLLAFYLYDQMRNKDQYPDSEMTMDTIVRKTGYTPPTIRSSYANLLKAGYRNMILYSFGVVPPDKKKDRQSAKPRKQNPASKTINPIILAIFDEYAELRKLPSNQRPTFKEFLDLKNNQYNTNFKHSNLRMKFVYIVEHGIRPALPDLQKVEKGDRTPNAIECQIFNEYEQIVTSYREKGLQLPMRDVIYRQLGDKYNRSPSVIRVYVSKVRTYLRKEATSAVTTK